MKNVASNQKGFLTLAVLLLALMGGVYIWSTFQSVRFVEKSVAQSSRRGELEKYKAEFYSKLDCAASFRPGVTCPSGAYLPLTAFNGTEFISRNGTTFAPYTFRAECSTANDGIVLRAAKLKPGASVTSTQESDFFKDQATSEAFDWDYSRGLIFGDDLALCSPRNPGKTLPPSSSSTYQDYTQIPYNLRRKREYRWTPEIMRFDNRRTDPSCMTESFMNECDNRHTQCPSGFSFPVYYGNSNIRSCTCICL